MEINAGISFISIFYIVGFPITILSYLTHIAASNAVIDYAKLGHT